MCMHTRVHRVLGVRARTTLEYAYYELVQEVRTWCVFIIEVRGVLYERTTPIIHTTTRVVHAFRDSNEKY